MGYNEFVQNKCYAQRIGKIYGCFEVVNIEYDKQRRKQLWTIKCVYCGRIKHTYNGKDYVKGKNHGNCQCQGLHKRTYEKSQKIKKEKPPVARDHPLYSRWKSIKDRCYNKNNKDYHNYGARGIGMCDEWRHDFWEFARWAESNGFSAELTIDRVDNDKDYSPFNCRWVTRSVQNKNKRNVSMYQGMTINDIASSEYVSANVLRRLLNHGMELEEAVGKARIKKENKNFIEKCKEKGCDPKVIRHRMDSGLSFDDAVKVKHINKYFCDIDGTVKSLAEWCKIYNITPEAVIYRMKVKKMGMREAIITPKSQGKKT